MSFLIIVVSKKTVPLSTVHKGSLNGLMYDDFSIHSHQRTSVGDFGLISYTSLCHIIGILAVGVSIHPSVIWSSSARVAWGSEASEQTVEKTP